jgi:hypothetical protein
MATQGLTLWSTTAASNGNADPAVGMQEGMAPSAVNDGIRALMASVAKWRDDLYGITTGGTSTAFTVTTGSTFATAAAMSGAVFTIIPHATSGASPTLAVDGLTARAINQSTAVAVATGALILGTPYLVKYVHASTEFILIGRSSVFTTLQTTGILTQSATSHGVLASGTTGQRVGTPAGGFRFNSTLGVPEFADGANYFPLLYTLAGAQLPYGTIINGTIVESRAANAATFALKTLAGNDPSAGDPVLIAFRSSSSSNGTYVYRTVTAALSLVLSSGSTLGVASGDPFKVWLVLFDDAGTVRIGAINTVAGASSPSIYSLGRFPRVSSTAEGGLGAADSAQVFYTDTAVTNKGYVPFAYASYETGLATAGLWAAAPTRLQLFGAGVPLPGETIQTADNWDGAVATGTTIIPVDDTIPQNTEGDQYLSQAITPTSAANVLDCSAQLYLANNTVSTVVAALFQDSTANALAAIDENASAASRITILNMRKTLLAGTTSATTFKVRAGGSGAGTTTFNGSGGTRDFGGVANSYLTIKEIMT